LNRQPERSDVLSTFAGIRPLVKAGGGTTASLSRDHVIRTDHPGLLTITGGKWTTYRDMAEDGVNRAAEAAGLPRRDCSTRELRPRGGRRGGPANAAARPAGSRSRRGRSPPSRSRIGRRGKNA